MPFNGEKWKAAWRWLRVTAPLLVAAGLSGCNCCEGIPSEEMVDVACLADSTVDGNGRLTSLTRPSTCSTYGAVTSRRSTSDAPITMDYLYATPTLRPGTKAVLVLIGGSNFDMGIVGDAASGKVERNGGNFLVRSTKIFAEAGYLAIALDRPSDMPSGPTDNEIGNVDRYRASVRHAIDILSVIQRLNTDDLDVFIVGTSRGTISATAQNMIGTGVVLSSPLTTETANNTHLYVDMDDPQWPNLRASSVKRPAMVMFNALDECHYTPPAASKGLAQKIADAGTQVLLVEATGGVKMSQPSGTLQPDPCAAYSYHAYLGIESMAVDRVTAWVDSQVAALKKNHRPAVPPFSVSGSAATSQTIDLATRASDRDGDTLSYSLPFSVSDLGGTVSLQGSVVTYTPPAGLAGRSDRFVFVVTDGKGGVGAAVATVNLGP